MRKTRPDSRLDQLPEHQQAMVYAHCDQCSLEEGVQWLRREFDLRVSVATLSRWLARTRRDEATAALAERLQRFRDATSEARSAGDIASAGEADQLLFAALDEYSVNLIAGADADPSEVAAIYRVLLRRQKQQLEERRLELDRRRLELLEAKARAYDGIRAAAEADDLTPAERLQRIREGLQLA